jgi:hypothetical protein
LPANQGASSSLGDARPPSRTRATEPITGAEQVRFRSMCTNELRKPYPVTDCAADDETELDDDGF